MNYKISLNALPQWVRYDLAKELKTIIESEKRDARISDFDSEILTHGDLPPEIIIQGSLTALTALIPIIYELLKKREVHVIYIKNDVQVIIHSHKTEKILCIEEILERDEDD